MAATSATGSNDLPKKIENVQNPDNIRSSSHESLRATTTEKAVILPERTRVHSLSKPKVAYAITVTKDGPFIDGALVLGYAAKRVHDIS